MRGEAGSRPEDRSEIAVLVHANSAPWLHGITYEARCDLHGRTTKTFTPLEVEMTHGQYKRTVTINSHRTLTACTCPPPWE